jgi:uncharacterized protein YqgV (UPF0045/DUF77 family)
MKDPCEYKAECRNEQRIQVAFRAATDERVKQIEKYAEDIKQSVNKMSSMLEGHVKDIYQSIGAVTQTLNAEVQNRMTADTNIERNITEKIDDVEVCLVKKITQAATDAGAKITEETKDKVSFKVLGLVFTVLTVVIAVLTFIFTYAPGNGVKPQ